MSFKRGLCSELNGPSHLGSSSPSSSPQIGGLFLPNTWINFTDAAFGWDIKL